METEDQTPDEGWQVVGRNKTRNKVSREAQKNVRDISGVQLKSKNEKTSNKNTTSLPTSSRSEGSERPACKSHYRGPLSARDEKNLKGMKTQNLYGVLSWMRKLPNEKKTIVQFDENVGITQEYINISLNYFGLKNLKLPRFIYHYEVAITRKNGNRKSLPQPYCQKILTNTIKEIYRQYELHHPNSNIGVISDLNNNLYSTKDLVSNSVEIRHQIVLLSDEETGDNEIFIVEINRTVLTIDTLELTKYAVEHAGSWKGMTLSTKLKTQTEQVYNALIKSIPRCKYVPVGRSGLIWWPANGNDGHSLGNGVVVWDGIYANFTIGWSFLMNIDITHATFHKSGPALDVIEELVSWKRNQKWQLKNFEITWINKAIKNCEIIYKVADSSSKQKWKELNAKVSGVCTESAADFTFLNTKTLKRMTVEEYFNLTYGMCLKYPHGPCLLFNAGKSRVPAEICRFVKGKHYDKTLREYQTNSLMKLARQDPKNLKSEIQKSMNEMMKPKECKELAEFGVEFQEALLNKKVRVLRPPDILYGEGLGDNKGKCARLTPEFGEWNIWDIDQQFAFLDVKDIPKFGYLVINDQMGVDKSDFARFTESLIFWSSKRGMKQEYPRGHQAIVKNTVLSVKRDDGPENIQILIKVLKEFKENGCKLVLVVLPDRAPETYGQVKTAAETRVGILTQCLVMNNLLERANEVMQHLVLKLNCKLGGTNHSPILSYSSQAILSEPILILGADVTHPPPNLLGKGLSPSFAAVTGCIQKNIMPYAMKTTAQKKANAGAAEIIDNLDTTVAEMIQQFIEHTEGSMPTKIFMFRDGVGEGQFKEVQDQEIKAIQKACGNFSGEKGRPYKPPITFICVQKRNKTRFFKHEDHLKNDGAITNAPAGTLMDTDIVHQVETDYYILSHRGLLGTSCPTRYRVLYDESNFDIDTLKSFTYYLCHTFQRCNKSVRIPAPTYYAHCAATRAKMFAEGQAKQNLTSLAAVNQCLSRIKEFSEKYPMHYI